MSTQTPRLSLNKPTAGDMDWASEINHNWDVLDDAVVVEGAAPADGTYLSMVDGAPAFTRSSPNDAALARTRTQMFVGMGIVLIVLIAVDVILHRRVLKRLATREPGGTP